MLPCQSQLKSPSHSTIWLKFPYLQRSSLKLHSPPSHYNGDSYDVQCGIGGSRMQLVQPWSFSVAVLTGGAAGRTPDGQEQQGRTRRLFRLRGPVRSSLSLSLSIPRISATRVRRPAPWLRCIWCAPVHHIDLEAHTIFGAIYVEADRDLIWIS